MVTKIPDGVIVRPMPGDLIPLMSPVQLLTHYLSASYGYYIHHENVWDDHDFDRLCHRLLELFDTFEHPHKHLTDKEALRAGTGFHISEHNYPAYVRHGWWIYVRRVNDASFEHDIREIHALGLEAWQQKKILLN